jgi:hypothetical protein
MTRTTDVRATDPVYDAIRTRRVTRRLQPVVPVHDAALLRLLRMVSPGMVARPQAALVIGVDTRRAAAFGFAPDAPGLFVDVGTTAATLLLAAHAVGLASCPVTSFSRSAVARLLGLAPGVRPEMIVCLGHADPVQPRSMAPLAPSS